MTRFLYIAHDLDDPAIWRRRTMLCQGGAEVDLAGFRRLDGPLPAPARVFGRTHNARMGQRMRAVARARVALGAMLHGLQRPDVILARNLETLPLALAAARRFGRPERPKVVYEVLDIHRLLLRDDAIGRGLRAVERRLMHSVDRVIVSSPAFRREYFERIQAALAPVDLVENRVVSVDGTFQAAPAREDHHTEPGDPLVIGWFGILRCRTSLRCLDAVTRAAPGRFRIALQGRPARDEIPEFDEIVARNPDLFFAGAYAYPDDLARIYGEIDLAWLVDRYDAGQNSDWLLPNRYYESGVAGVPAIGLEGTEVAREMRRRGIGLLLKNIDFKTVMQTLTGVTPARLADLRAAQQEVASSTWIAGPAEGRALVDRLVSDERTDLARTRMEAEA